MILILITAYVVLGGITMLFYSFVNDTDFIFCGNSKEDDNKMLLCWVFWPIVWVYLIIKFTIWLIWNTPKGIWWFIKKLYEAIVWFGKRLYEAIRDEVKKIDFSKLNVKNLKVTMLLIPILLLTSCGPLYRCEYMCTITYNLDGISHTQSVTMETDKGVTPTYVYTGNELKIVTIPYSQYYNNIIIYKGVLPVTIENFNYEHIRTYRASWWDGRELKKK